MAENVVNQQEISLDGKRYRIAPRRGASVRSFIASRYPGKLVLGDVGSDSDPRRSVVKWTDQRGGLGVYKLDARDPELDRCAYTSCDVRYKGGITLPPLSRYTTGARTVGKHHGHRGTERRIRRQRDLCGMGRRDGHPQVRRQGRLVGRVAAHAAGRGDGRGDDLTPGCKRPFAVPRLRARGRGVHVHLGRDDLPQECQDPRSSLRTGTTVSGGFDDDGRLWQGPAGPLRTSRYSCINDAALPLPPGYVTSLFVGPDRSGRPILYAGTKGRALRSRRRKQPLRRDAREVAEARHRRIGRDGLEGRHLRAGRPARVRLLAGTPVVRLRVPTSGRGRPVHDGRRQGRHHQAPADPSRPRGGDGRPRRALHAGGHLPVGRRRRISRALGDGVDVDYGGASSRTPTGSTACGGRPMTGCSETCRTSATRSFAKR